MLTKEILRSELQLLMERMTPIKEQIGQLSNELEKLIAQGTAIEALMEIRGWASGPEKPLEVDQPDYFELAEEYLSGRTSPLATTSGFSSWLQSRGIEEPNRNSIRVAFEKLKNSGHIRVLQTGAGRKATIYRVVKRPRSTQGDNNQPISNPG